MWPVCPHRAAPSESLLSMESKEFILSYDIFVALLSYEIILKHLHVFIQIFIQHTKEEQSNLSVNC